MISRSRTSINATKGSLCGRSGQLGAQLGEDTVSEAYVGDLKQVDACGFHDRESELRGRNDDVGAVGAQSKHVDAVARIHPQEMLAQFRELRASHREDRASVQECDAKFTEALEVAAGPDRDVGVDVLHGLLQKIANGLHQLFDDLFALTLFQLSLVHHLQQTNGSHLERLRVLRNSVIRERELDASAADVDEQGGFVVQVHSVGDGREDVFALLDSVDDVDLDSTFLFHLCDESIAILGFAKCGRRDCFRVDHVVSFQEVFEFQEGFERFLSRFVRELAGPEDVFSEPDGLAHFLDDANVAVVVELSDHEAYGVGSDVDGRDRLHT